MATHLVRLRRAVISASGIRRTLTSISSTSPSPQLSPFPSQSPTAPPPLPSPPSSSYSPSSMLLLARSFRSTRTASLAARSSYNSNYDDGDKIDPDTILFEGCDFNHWLITMDFPKDPKPTPEEMVRTYEETCAKGLNISLEEAKKKIYACSTTTYQGFQALMTEAESEQFRGLPGVVFILPDSYIDPQNKEYGGDKYENGVITPRPPPVQYGRPGRRYSGQQRYDRLGGQAPNRQGNLQYDNQGPMQRGAPGNYPPQQNYGPSAQGDRRNPMPLNRDYASGGGDPYQTQRINPQPYQGNYNQQAQGDRWNSAPSGQNDYRRDNRSYGPTPGGSYGQGGAGGFHGQGTSGVYGQGGAGAFHGQNTSGSYGQGGASGFQGQSTSGGYGQEVNSGYGQGYMQHGEGHGFEPGTQRRMQEDTTSYNPVGQGGADQRRY